MSIARICRRSVSIATAWVLVATHSVYGFTQSGNTYTTTGIQSDVSAALAAAPSGSFILIPSGTFTWGAGNTSIVINNAVTLAGAGPGNTIIDLDPTGPTIGNGVIKINSNAVVGAFTINQPTSSNVVPFAVSSSTSGWRITNITYNAGASDGYFCIVNLAYGLIDSCTINDTNAESELIFGRGPLNSWQTSDSLGTANNVYIENCTFNGPAYVCDANSNARFVVRYCTITGISKIDGHGLASNTPARGVREMEIYRNTWTSSTPNFTAVDLRGGTGVLFDNQAKNLPASQAWFVMEEYGTENFWPNFGQTISSETVANPTVITTAVAHGLQSGWGPVQVQSPNSTPAISSTYTVTVTSPTTFTIPVNVTIADANSAYETTYQTPYDYPIGDQIGVGEDPKSAASDPVYLWNNTALGGADWTLTWTAVAPGAVTFYQTQTGNGAATFTMQNVIQADIDYFKQTVGATFTGSTGVGRGTTAAMNSITPTKVGVGFWCYDQGSWDQSGDGLGSGALYVWNGSAWVLKYTPYTYPHPLRLPIAPSSLGISSP